MTRAPAAADCSVEVEQFAAIFDTAPDVHKLEKAAMLLLAAAVEDCDHLDSETFREAVSLALAAYGKTREALIPIEAAEPMPPTRTVAEASARAARRVLDGVEPTDAEVAADMARNAYLKSGGRLQ